MDDPVTLHFFCGKMAAGKSTLARRVAEADNAVLLVEDDWLAGLYPEEIHTIPDYLKYSGRLKARMFDHVAALLGLGQSVVMDFPANTVEQRGWFRRLFEQAGADHLMHYLDVSDTQCKRQLAERSRDKPPGAAFTTEAEFDAITQYFQPPSDAEGFNLVRHTGQDA